MPTVYVDGEGPTYLDECMAAAFDCCKGADIKVLVIFTSTGEGPCKALDKYLSREEFAGVRLIAVTPPVNKQYRSASGEPVRAGIQGERFTKLRDANVPIVSARLPFRSILAHPDPISQPPEGVSHLVVAPALNFDAMHAVDRVLGIFGGGISLCVQSVLMACDAGAVTLGERVVVMSADTAIVALACHSESFLSPHTGMIVDHIVCRPRVYTISKPHHYVTQAWIDETDDDDEHEVVLLPSGADVPELPAATDEPKRADDQDPS